VFVSNIVNCSRINIFLSPRNVCHVIPIWITNFSKLKVLLASEIMNRVYNYDSNMISWTDHVRNEEVLHRVKEERNILHAIKEGRLPGLVTSSAGTAF